MVEPDVGNGQAVAAQAAPLHQRRVWLGAASVAMAHGITAGQTLLLVPLFLLAWGGEGYGRWLILSTIVANLTLLDFGAQSYVGNLLAMQYARGAADEFRRTLSEGVSLFICIGVAAFVPAALLVVGVGFVAAPGLGRPLSPYEVYTLLALLPLPLLTSVPGGVYITAYRATGRYARSAMVANGVRAIGIVVSAAALYFRVSIPTFALVTLGVGVALTATLVWDSRRVMPECRALKLSVAAAWSGRRLLPPSLHFWLLSLSQTANQHGLLLVIGAALGPVAAAAYATHRALATIPVYMATLLQGPLMPELSALWARHERTVLEHTVLSAVRLVTIASGLAAIFVWVSTPLIYATWTSGSLPLSPIVLGLLLLQAVLYGAWFTSGWILLAINKHQTLAALGAVNAAVTIAVGFFASSAWGITGAVAASVAADIICGLAVFPVLAMRALERPSGPVYREIGRSLTGIAAIAVASGLATAGYGAWFGYTILAAASAIFLHAPLRRVERRLRGVTA